MTAAAEDKLDRFASRVVVVNNRGRVFDARCPAHDDTKASLVFGYGDTGGVVFHCHAGCLPDMILSAAGLTWADVSPEPHVVATYDYRDESGELLWAVQRWEPKDFRVAPGLPPIAQRRLYHSEWLPAARQTDRPVYVVEGEKDADRLADQCGQIAVCGVGGAGKWLPGYADQLAGLTVVVVADADEAGRGHARAVVGSLDGLAEVSLLVPAAGKDISDHLDAGYTLAGLESLALTDELGVHRMDHVAERGLEWLWPGYLPLGKLAIIEGDPGDGKSVLTVDLTARFSTGAPLPDGAVCPLGPVPVVMVSAEDDPADTIKPRLRVAGAHEGRVQLIVEGPGGRPFDLGCDLDSLEALVIAHGIKLVVIDPLMAFLPGNVDSHRDHEVRRALTPLSKMANRTGCVVLVVRHLTKSRTKAIYAGGGSIAFTASARVVFLVGPHPEDEAKRVLGCTKFNLGPTPAALAYRVAGHGEPSVPTVVWDTEPLQVSAQDILDGEGGSDEREVRNEAREWLSGYLRNHHEGVSWAEIVRASKREIGCSEITLRRVRKGVARKVTNPVDAHSHVRRGTYWLPLGDNTVRDESALLAQLAQAPAPEQVEQVKSDTPPNVEPSDADGNGEVGREPPPKGPCDVCGDEQALPFGHPHYVVRCRAHNPMTYSG